MKRHAPIRSREFFVSGHFNEPAGEWRYASEKLARLQDFVFDIKVRKQADRTITLEGNVASEQVKRLFEEILTDYDPTSIIANELEVTAPFLSAEDDDFAIEMKGSLSSVAAPSAGRTSVARYPLFTTLEKPVVGRLFHFEVDLTAAPSGQQAVVFDLPSEWQMATIDVDVVSEHLEFQERMKCRKIVLFDDGRSMSARFEGTVTGASPEGTVDVLLSFMCEGRYVSSARATFEIETEPGAQPSPPAPSAVIAFPEAKAPDLTIRIYNAGKPTSWLWFVNAPYAQDLCRGTLNEIVDMPDPETFATGLLRQCPALTSPQHSSRLRGIGEQIWARAPDIFRNVYRNMRERFGPAFPIQIVTAEPHVPWEMMFPDDSSGIANPDHLYMSHPMCRWSATYEGSLRPDLNRGSIASFVPNYPDGFALPSAIAEGEWLVSQLGAKAMDPTWKSFTSFWTTELPTERVAVLHFAGHGESKPDPRIKMLDGYISRDEVNGAVKLGNRDGTFVVLNACETGATEIQLGLASGWTERLIKHSFRGVLAPLWKVEDDCASQVVKTFLTKLYRRVPLGTALLQARKAQRDQSATPFAYACHGDVNAEMR